MDTYKRRFKALLYLEEVQMEVDIRKYDLEGVTMKVYQQNKRLLMLEVRFLPYFNFLSLFKCLGHENVLDLPKLKAFADEK